MKEQELKGMISNSFIALAPNRLERLLEECAATEQYEGCGKKAPRILGLGRNIFRSAIAIAVCIALFFCGVMIGGYSPAGSAVATAQSVIYLDVNPSIEIKVDSQSRVIEVIAGNEDAVGVLDGLQLKGVEMNTALTAIVGAMYMNGYFSESANSILVSVDTDDEDSESLLTGITERISTVLGSAGIECSIIAQSLVVDDELRERAEERGVSVGKLHLVDRMIGGMEHLCEEDAPELSDMSIKELNLIYSTRPGKNGENDPFGKDISSGSVAGFIGEDTAVEYAIEALEQDAALIEWTRVCVELQGRGQSRRMVYRVLVGLKEDAGIFEALVDCVDGTVEILGLKQGGDSLDNEHKEDDQVQPSDSPGRTEQQGDKNEKGDSHAPERLERKTTPWGKCFIHNPRYKRRLNLYAKFQFQIFHIQKRQAKICQQKMYHIQIVRWSFSQN